MKIFTIGNSHSYDATQLLYEVFKAQDPEQEVVIGTMYYSGCSIAKHVKFAMNDDPENRMSRHWGKRYPYSKRTHGDESSADSRNPPGSGDYCS